MSIIVVGIDVTCLYAANNTEDDGYEVKKLEKIDLPGLDGWGPEFVDAGYDAGLEGGRAGGRLPGGGCW